MWEIVFFRNHVENEKSETSSGSKDNQSMKCGQFLEYDK